MFYVILNHTNPTVRLMVDDWGCLLCFRHKSQAIKEGEYAVNNGDAWEYLVVQAIER
jgi:hypothetical protein